MFCPKIKDFSHPFFVFILLFQSYSLSFLVPLVALAQMTEETPVPGLTGTPVPVPTAIPTPVTTDIATPVPTPVATPVGTVTPRQGPDYSLSATGYSPYLCNGGNDICAPQERLFPEQMVRICRRQGGGAACSLPNWDRNFYRSLLSQCIPQFGLESCLDLSCETSGTEICTSDMSSFPPAMVERCKELGGGDKECEKGRWNKIFYNQIFARCKALSGVEECITDVSKNQQNLSFLREPSTNNAPTNTNPTSNPSSNSSTNANATSLLTISKWLPEWSGMVSEALQFSRNKVLLTDAGAPQFDLESEKGAQLCPGILFGHRSTAQRVLDCCCGKYCALGVGF